MLPSLPPWSALLAADFPLRDLLAGHDLTLDERGTLHMGNCPWIQGVARDLLQPPVGADAWTMATCTRCSAQHPALLSMVTFGNVWGNVPLAVAKVRELLTLAPNVDDMDEAREGLAHATATRARLQPVAQYALAKLVGPDVYESVCALDERHGRDLDAARALFADHWFTMQNLTGPLHLVLAPRGRLLLQGSQHSCAAAQDGAIAAVLSGATVAQDADWMLLIVPDVTGTPWWQDAYDDYLLDDLGPAAGIPPEAFTVFAATYTGKPAVDPRDLLQAACTVLT